MAKPYPVREMFLGATGGDVQGAERLLIREKRLIEGICPNNCGHLTNEDARIRRCSKCGFRGQEMNGEAHA